jgi:hypothetical protein
MTRRGNSINAFIEIRLCVSAWVMKDLRFRIHMLTTITNHHLMSIQFWYRTDLGIQPKVSTKIGASLLR